MSYKIKIGIVGAGVFGGYHAAKCKNHPNIIFMGIYDHTVAQSQELASKFNTKVYSNYPDLLSAVDAVIISSPASSHGPLSIQALQAGVHCLIEKPIAATMQDARRIVELARSNNCIVQVGHQERFVVKAIGLDKISEMPRFITAFRMSKYSKRGTDVSVTLDLMTHDLDLLSLLTKERPITVQGVPISVQSTSADASLGHLTFPSGTKARMHASRIETKFRRTMDITYPSGTVSIDFNAKTVTHDTPFDLDTDFATNPLAKDSLGAATNAFVEAILNGKLIPVNAEDGLTALEMALAIDGEIEWETRNA